MENTPKPIGPFVVGQVVGFVDKAESPAMLNFSPAGIWYAVSTEPRQESLAMAEIAERGIVTYLPIIPRQEAHGRGRVRTCERPMFPSYLFACCEGDNWSRICSARGVNHVVGTVPRGAIEVVRLCESEEVEREGARLAGLSGGKSRIIWHFSPGQQVTIKKGPFAGFCAQLESAVDDHDRIKALVSLFGTKTRTEFSAFDIEAL